MESVLRHPAKAILTLVLSLLPGFAQPFLERQAVRAGKVRYLGASSMAAWQLSKALYSAKEKRWHRFVAMQNHYNLDYREDEREMIPLCMDQGLALIP